MAILCEKVNYPGIFGEFFGFNFLIEIYIKKYFKIQKSLYRIEILSTQSLLEFLKFLSKNKSSLASSALDGRHGPLLTTFMSELDFMVNFFKLIFCLKQYV